MAERKKLTVGSLFAGIGGLELGLEWTGGFKTVWQVENDSYAQAVLKKHWPDVGRWGDVRTFPLTPAEDWRCDVICGGFPCQDISNAGKRAGIDGERSGLWSEFARIICILRPRYVLVENVAALLTGGIQRVLGDLAESGYDAEWECLPAAIFGAPHLRDRVFIIAHTKCNVFDKHVGLRRVHDTRTHANGLTHLRNTKIGSKDWEQFELDSGRVAPEKWTPTGQSIDSRPLLLRNDDGVSNRVDRLRCLGNAVVPQVARWIGERILEVENK